MYSGKKRDIGFQASSDEECIAWVEAILRAAFAVGDAATSTLKPKVVPDEGELSEPPGNAGKAGKGKAKGKGKGPPVPPPPPRAAGAGEGDGPVARKGSDGHGKASGKGKGSQGKSRGKGQEEGPKALPFGRKMALWGAAEELRRPTALCEGSGEAHESVFDGLIEGRGGKVQEDIQVLMSVFKSPKDPAKESSPVKKVTPELAAGGQVNIRTQVFSQRVAQNSAIILRCLPVRGEDLVRVVASLMPGPLDSEKLERLVEALPGPEQMQSLLAYEGPEEKLRDLERQLLPLARLPRLPQRLQILGIAARFEKQQETAASQLAAVHAACSELRTSRMLRHVLAAVLVMFNYVNFGQTGSREARAFDITTLLHLDQFKAAEGPFRNFNGLHFVLTRLLAEGLEFKAESLISELGHLQQAAQVSLTDIQAAINLLQKDAQFLHDERTSHPTAYGGKPPAAPRLDILERAAEEEEPGPPASPMLSPEGTSDIVVPRDGCTPVRVPRPRQSNVWNMIRGWMRNQAGLEGNIQNTAPTLEFLPPDGAPAPAMLLNGDPDTSPSTQPWQPVRVEIPAPGLLLFSEVRDASEGGDVDDAYYAVVAGAEVLQLSSPLASLEARGESLEGKHPQGAFELQNVALQGNLSAAGSARLWLGSDDTGLSSHWFSALKAQSVAPGAGFLWVSHGSGIWRWRWATLCSSRVEGSTRLLVWYRTPGEMLRGEQPIGGVQLGGRIEVQTFVETGSKEAIRRPFGFKVTVLGDDAEAKATWASQVVQPSVTSLCATSQADMEQWIKALHGVNARAARRRLSTQDFATFISDAPEMTPRKREMKADPSEPKTPRLQDIFEFIGLDPAELPLGATPRDTPASPRHPTSPRRAPVSPRRALVTGARASLTQHQQRSTTTVTITEESDETDTCSSVSSDEGSDDGDSDAERSHQTPRRSHEGDLPIHQLGLLAQRLDASVGQLTQGLNAATAECRRLLTYFRQQSHDANPLLLQQQVHTFFSSVHAFSVKLKVAFEDVARHRQACLRRGQGDPFVTACGPERQSTREWQRKTLSLFDFQLPPKSLQSREAGSSSWTAKQQLQAKLSARSAVFSLVERGILRIYARWSLERAVLQAIEPQEGRQAARERAASAGAPPPAAAPQGVPAQGPRPLARNPWKERERERLRAAQAASAAGAPALRCARSTAAERPRPKIPALNLAFGNAAAEATTSEPRPKVPALNLALGSAAAEATTSELKTILNCRRDASEVLSSRG